ncbi:MAG: N-acetylmuramoyl-L-alanine amidase [Deltaproteobacteria bacterium]|nr:N-acetylmuramoyl-L-alanine amidase [Deltaproteobacteria bacterium]
MVVDIGNIRKQLVVSRPGFLAGILLLGMICSWLLLAGPAAAGQEDELAYRQAKKHYNAFNADRRLWAKRKNWTRLISEFKAVQRRYPGSKRADDALFLAARLYSSLHNYSGWRADLEKAAGLYQQLLDKYPRSHLADDALYHLGMIESQLGHPEKAKALYRRVIQDFPDGDMAAKAKKRLVAAAVKASGRRQANASCPANSSGKEVYQAGRPRAGSRLKGKAQVKNIRYWSSPTYTRVVIDLSQDVTYTKGVLKHEKDRKKIKSVYLDLHNSYYLGNNLSMLVNDGILKKIKVAQYNKQTVRAVIYLDSVEDYKIFALSSPSRIVIDVIGDRRQAKTTARRPRNGGAKSKKATGTLSLAQQLGLGIGTIVIDAGHGGRDPGAIGPHRLREKDVVLDIAKRLRKRLQELLHCKVIMTRDHDCFIPLEGRTVIANTKHADLFVSIHANASRNRRAQGVETYFLNLATDKEAMELAARENATSTKKISDLQLILNDLMRNSKINESSRLARTVQDNLVANLRRNYRNVKNLGVKQAPFYVLLGAQMPSILVETSFISNQMEEKRLQSPAYRQQIADGIAAGIKVYVDETKMALARP